MSAIGRIGSMEDAAGAADGEADWAWGASAPGWAAIGGVGAIPPPPWVAVGWAPPADGCGSDGAAETVMTEAAGMASATGPAWDWLAMTSVVVVAAGCGVGEGDGAGRRAIRIGRIAESTANGLGRWATWFAESTAIAEERATSTAPARGAIDATRVETGQTVSRVKSSGRRERGLRGGEFRMVTGPGFKVFIATTTIEVDGRRQI